MNLLKLFGFVLAISCFEGTQAFTHPNLSTQLNPPPSFYHSRRNVSLNASTEEKAAIEVTGEELEMMLTEWDTPLLIDAYATWCGPCLLMAPEFEAAAQEMKGKVRFVKLDTDKEPDMAGRLNVMGLPTLLFLGRLKPEGGEEESDKSQVQAVLMDRIEGALRKDSILALCDYHYFGGPRPEQL